MRKLLLTLGIILCAISISAQTTWSVGMTPAQTRNAVNNKLSSLESTKATLSQVRQEIADSNQASLSNAESISNYLYGGSGGVVDSVKVLTSAPSRGNIYINLGDKKIHWIVGGYDHWNKKTSIDSVAVAVPDNTQNLFTYSEQLDNSSAWPTSSTVVANQANDVLGNNTLEHVTITEATGNIGRDNFTVTASTSYSLSFDVKRGTQGTDAVVVVYDVSNDYATIIAASYWSSTSSTVTRLTFNFTTPSGCIRIAAIPYTGSIIGDNVYLGRIQLSAPGKDYVTTTSTPKN